MQFRVCQLKMLLALLLLLRQKELQGETSNTVQLTSSSTGLDSTKQSSKYVVNCIKQATESKPVKLETDCTVIFLL